MDFQGKIIFKSALETVGQNGTQKLSLVLEEISDREYKASVLLEQLGEKVNLFADFNIGDVVKVGINPRAREYNGRRYNSLLAWKVEGVSKGNGAADAAAQSDGDLPF
jgi:hypothetical protein